MPSENVVIYADKREASSRIISILKKHCTVEEAQLEVGDYLLSERVCAERKTSIDFISSIMDKRLFQQLANMKENFERPLLVIEGGSLFESGININENAIRGALASVAIDYSMPIIWTHNQLETAKMLYRIAHREQIGGGKNTGLRGKRRLLSKNQEQEFLIEGFPGISNVTAKKLLNHFGTCKKIFSASESELQKADGIGKETAKRIFALLSRKYEESVLDD